MKRKKSIYSAIVYMAICNACISYWLLILCQTECNTRNTVIVSQANSKFSKEKLQGKKMFFQTKTSIAISLEFETISWSEFKIFMNITFIFCWFCFFHGRYKTFSIVYHCKVLKNSMFEYIFFQIIRFYYI